MAVGAYVLVNVNAGKANAALAAVRRIKGVKQAHLVTGLHDLVAYLEAPTLKDLGAAVVSKLQKATGVNKTVTCIVVDKG